MKLKRGINLGGFLSQCEHSIEHYRTYIGESDIEKIAGMGFDHVRLPIDYEVLEDEDGNAREDCYDIVTSVVLWCKKNNLDIILDLHKARGYDFNDAGSKEKNNLFTSSELVEEFLRLWSEIAKRYAKYDHVAFELLNEVVEADNEKPWNELIRKAVATIRQYTKDAYIIYGGIQWNSANTVELLDKPLDDRCIFTFHFYEPILFTHQKAYWVNNMNMDMTVKYPDSVDFYFKETVKLGYQGEGILKSGADVVGIPMLEAVVKNAVNAAEKAGVRLYCGEFGVIDRAPLEDTLNWFRDVNEVFCKYDIGCAVWSYKEMDFGLVDSHYDDIRDELLKIWNN